MGNSKSILQISHQVITGVKEDLRTTGEKSRFTALSVVHVTKPSRKIKPNQNHTFLTVCINKLGETHCNNLTPTPSETKQTVKNETDNPDCSTLQQVKAWCRSCNPVQYWKRRTLGHHSVETVTVAFVAIKSTTISWIICQMLRQGLLRVAPHGTNLLHVNLVVSRRPGEGMCSYLSVCLSVYIKQEHQYTW